MMWDHSTANSWDLYGRAMELLEGDGCKRNVPDAAALLRCAVFGDRRSTSWACATFTGVARGRT